MPETQRREQFPPATVPDRHFRHVPADLHPRRSRSPAISGVYINPSDGGSRVRIRLAQDIFPSKTAIFKGDNRGFLPLFLPQNGVHQDRFTLPITSRRCSLFPPQPTY